MFTLKLTLINILAGSATVYHCRSSPVSFESKNLSHGGFLELFIYSYNKHMLLMMGHLIIWITSSVVHSDIWEGELHRHLDQDDIIHGRSIRIGIRSTSPDRGNDTWKPFYQSLDCFECLGEGFFHVSRFLISLQSVCFLHIRVFVHVGIIIIFSRVSSVNVSSIAPSVESCCVPQLEYPRAA